VPCFFFLGKEEFSSLKFGTELLLPNVLERNNFTLKEIESTNIIIHGGDTMK
jgi:hypothetical protein